MKEVRYVTIIIVIICLAYLMLDCFLLKTDEKQNNVLIESNFTPKNNPRFASLSPALTEIMYKINADDMLVGISTECDRILGKKDKKIIGNTYFTNYELLADLKPDYLLTANSYNKGIKYKNLIIKQIYFDIKSVDDVLNSILKMGTLTSHNKEAETLYKTLKLNIKNSKKEHKTKILYLIQTNPYITIGKSSYITDVIRHSGNQSATENLKNIYPVITEEYMYNLDFDVILIAYKGSDDRLMKLFPDKKIIYLNKYENDIVNRPSARIDEAVKFFASVSP